MKRHVTLAFVATSLLAGAGAFAAGNPYMVRGVASQVVRDNGNDRGHDRGRDGRGHDNRGHDDRHDNDHGGNRPPPSYDHGHDRQNWDRHDDRPNRDRRDDGRDRNHDGRDDRSDHYRGGGRNPNYWDNRGHDRRDHATYRYNYGYYRPPAGYYYRTWRRGDRLPRGWYGSSYVVNDWRPYRLYQPPYGYHWVRVGNDVVLTAIATGIVLDVLYDIWY